LYFACGGENNVTRTTRGDGELKLNVAVGLARPSAGTKVAARSEGADAAHAELCEQVTYGPHIAPRDALLVVSI
jgi:hypothetical protein